MAMERSTKLLELMEEKPDVRVLMHLMLTEYTFTTFDACRLLNTLPFAARSRRQSSKHITEEDFAAAKQEHEHQYSLPTADLRWAAVFRGPGRDNDSVWVASRTAIEGTAQDLGIRTIKDWGRTPRTVKHESDHRKLTSSSRKVPTSSPGGQDVTSARAPTTTPSWPASPVHERFATRRKRMPTQARSPSPEETRFSTPDPERAMKLHRQQIMSSSPEPRSDASESNIIRSPVFPVRKRLRRGLRDTMKKTSGFQAMMRPPSPPASAIDPQEPRHTPSAPPPAVQEVVRAPTAADMDARNERRRNALLPGFVHANGVDGVESQGAYVVDRRATSIRVAYVHDARNGSWASRCTSSRLLRRSNSI